MTNYVVPSATGLVFCIFFLPPPTAFFSSVQAHTENQKSAEVLWVNRVYGGAEEFSEDHKLRERQ